MNILKELDIGKFSAIWAFLTGGWAGLAKLIVEAFSKLLSKADPEKLKYYSELASKIAKFIRYGIDLFATDEDIKEAIIETAETIDVLASHIADGKYDEKELDSDIDNIIACIEAWKAIVKREAK